MAISFDDIEKAFLFVSLAPQYTHNAYLNKETGDIYYSSDLGDSDILPDDIEDEKYTAIPDKYDLDLGKNLVFEFTRKYLPEKSEKVYSIFEHKGAYSRFKNLLERKGKLDDWHSYEDERQKSALKNWCQDNGIEVTG
jgi:hypothetical protein